MRDTPWYVEKTTTYVPESSFKKRAKETEETAVSQQDKNKGKKLQFSPKVFTSPRKLVSRSITKRNPSMHRSKSLDEYIDAFTETNLPIDKYILINELQEQLKKAHFSIAQLQHENKEMKKKSLEKASKKIY